MGVDSGKHRRVETIEELAALEVFAVVRSARGLVYEKNGILNNPDEIWWEQAGVDGYQPNTSIDLPATLLSDGLL